MQLSPDIDIANKNPPPETHYELVTESYFGNRIQIANAIAEQIWREQQLVSNRMQWNLTFQAFLSGIYVFAGSNLNGWEAILVQIALAVAGLFVVSFCLLGVIAAQNQSHRLKTHWVNEFCKTPPEDPGECDIVKGAFPQPFSKTKGSRRGRHVSRNICFTLMGMWVLMLIITLSVNFLLNKPDTSIRLSCKMEASAINSSEISISCKPK